MVTQALRSARPGVSQAHAGHHSAGLGTAQGARPSGRFEKRREQIAKVIGKQLS